MKCHTYKYLLVPLLGFVLAFTFSSINPVAAQEEPQLNILLMRAAYIKDGKVREAVQFAKEIIEYENNLIPDRKVRAYFEIFGDVGKIYWIVEDKDLAAVQSNTRKLMTDPGWHAILGKAVGLFIEGKTHDTGLSLIR